MKVKDADIIFVSGDPELDDGHWQARWQGRLSTARRLKVESADTSSPKALIDRVAGAVNEADRPVVLVAHGVAVAAAIHAAASFRSPVAGAFLVAPADPASCGFPAPPRGPLVFPSILVASRNDPKCDFEIAEELAADMGSLFIDAGEVGGIDASSGHGPWPEGSMTFARFVSRLAAG